MLAVTPGLSAQLPGGGGDLLRAVQEDAPQWSLSAGKVFWFVVLLVAGYLVVNWLSRALSQLAERWPRSRLSIKRALPVARIIGWIIIIYLLVAGVLAPPLATLLALTASAGVAVGFAAQDVLKNIFGGLMILFDRPFQVGDKVQIGDHYGEVTAIGLRTVRLVTPDDSLVSVPNSEIVGKSVSNSNAGESYAQVVAHLYLPASVDLAAVKRVARLAAATSRMVYLAKPIAIVVKNAVHQGRSLLEVRLKAYVFDVRYEFAFLSEMTETVVAELIARRIVHPDELSRSERAEYES